MEDNSLHKVLRAELVRSLVRKGILNSGVLEALGKVPRHLFIPKPVTPEEAYEDKAMEIEEGQTISQPYTVAYQTSMLDPRPGEKILEVGTGSGYQGAVLFELGVTLYSIERQKKLYSSAKLRLAELGYGGIHTSFGDGSEGWPQFAPFDKILVTAAAPGIPAALVEQLRTGGVMIIPVNGRLQKMLKVTKMNAHETKVEEFDEFRFVPLLRGVKND